MMAVKKQPPGELESVELMELAVSHEGKRKKNEQFSKTE